MTKDEPPSRHTSEQQKFDPKKKGNGAIVVIPFCQQQVVVVVVVVVDSGFFCAPKTNNKSSLGQSFIKPHTRERHIQCRASGGVFSSSSSIPLLSFFLSFFLLVFLMDPWGLSVRHKTKKKKKNI
jgi:hypothetical protein